MAPLPPNSTKIFYFDYTTGRVEHTFQVRVSGPTPSEVVFDAVLEFLVDLAPLLPSSWRVLGARVRQAGAIITLPEELPAAMAAFVGTAGAAPDETFEPREHVFVGRSAGGRRVEVSIYGIETGFVPAYRIVAPGAGTPLGAARATLSSAPGVWIGIDGTTVTWYNYVNQNNNSYWETRARRGL